MFTDLYLYTTNPNLDINKLLSFNIQSKILFAIIFHIIIYISFFNIIAYIFTNKLLNMQINNRLIIVLFVIMFIGYIGRFLHIKDIYRAFNYDINKTNNFVNTHYNTWLFIA